MPDYEVLLRRRAEKQLDRVPYVDHPHLVKAILALGDDPHPPGCRKLLEDIYRIRLGTYRVIFKIDDERKEVVVGNLAPNPVRNRHEEAVVRDCSPTFSPAKE